MKKEEVTGNSHWFRFQISANSFVNFFYEPCSEVVEMRKLMFLHKFNDFAGYKETLLNFWRLLVMSTVPWLIWCDPDEGQYN